MDGYSAGNQPYDHQQYHHQTSQIQPYDPSTLQSYDAYNQQQHQSAQYHPSDYPNIYPQHAHQHQYQQEPSSIHPPGVPIPPGPSHTAGPQYAHLNNSYYPSGFVENQQLQFFPGSESTAASGFNPAAASAAVAFSQLTQFTGNVDATAATLPIGQTSYGAGGRRGGWLFRGSGRGQFGQHGLRPDGLASSVRGRGRSRGGSRNFPAHGMAFAPAVGGPVSGDPLWPPPPMAWCELCRVDCNTPEILEQHKNGKRHKKNVQIHDELQNLNKIITEQQSSQITNSELKPECVQPLMVEGCAEKEPPLENVTSEVVPDIRSETEKHKDVLDKSEVSVDELGAERKPKNHLEARGRGFKRRMRGRRGGKYIGTDEGPQTSVEPPKSKDFRTPWMCELCNVKCESQVVFDTHLAGKKHLSNLKRFQGHRALYGEAGVQALYPPNFNAASTSIIPQVQQQGIYDLHLQQQGYDPQVLLAQLLTYVLSQNYAQAQATGAPVSTAGWELTPVSGPSSEIQVEQTPHTQASEAISGGENQTTVMVEAKHQQESSSTKVDSPQ